MAKFYQIRIGTIYLTDDGTAEAGACKLSINGVEDLQVSVSGSSQIAAAGNRVRQPIEWTAGKEFSITVQTVKAELYETIKDFLNEKNESDAGFTVSGIGDSGDFSVTAKPALIKPFACAGFRNGRIKDVVLRFET